MIHRRSLIAAAAAALAATAAPAQDEPIEMVLTNEVATTHWKAALMEEFAERIRERSGGRIDAQVFHAGTLYTSRDAVGALGTGAVHMVWPVSVQLESLAPEYGVINLPFAIDDTLMMTEGAAPALAEMVSQYVADRGIRVMGLMRAAELMFLYEDKVVDAPDKLGGDKIRMTGGRVLQSLMRELGANPISMPASEMATALMQGAIDGIYTSSGGWQMVGANAAEIATHIPGMGLVTYTVLADDAWLENLPEDLREVVISTTEELLADQWASGIESDQATAELMIEQGGRLVTVEGAALEKFRSLAVEASDAFIERHPDVWEEFQATVAKFR